jgi:histidyl-tRNA synthetase
VGEDDDPPPIVVVVPMGNGELSIAAAVLADLRAAGVTADMAFAGNFKRRLTKADATGAHFAAIIGEAEVASASVALKNLRTGDQCVVATADLVEAVK